MDSLLIETNTLRFLRPFAFSTRGGPSDGWKRVDCRARMPTHTWCTQGKIVQTMSILPGACLNRNCHSIRGTMSTLEV